MLTGKVLTIAFLTENKNIDIRKWHDFLLEESKKLNRHERQTLQYFLEFNTFIPGLK